MVSSVSSQGALVLFLPLAKVFCRLRLTRPKGMKIVSANEDEVEATGTFARVSPLSWVTAGAAREPPLPPLQTLYFIYLLRAS